MAPQARSPRSIAASTTMRRSATACASSATCTALRSGGPPVLLRHCSRDSRPSPPTPAPFAWEVGDSLVNGIETVLEMVSSLTFASTFASAT
eukprot:4230640-Pleurochrysis_carterae.AAC.1